MSADVLEPGQEPEEPSEGAVALAEKPVPEVPQKPFYREICASCRRPLIELDGRGYVHLDARIDMPDNPAFCIAELYVEPQTPWGFLDVKGKSDFSVGQGPSKVREGWSGGGVA